MKQRVFSLIIHVMFFNQRSTFQFSPEHIISRALMFKLFEKINFNMKSKQLQKTVLNKF